MCFLFVEFYSELHTKICSFTVFLPREEWTRRNEDGCFSYFFLSFSERKRLPFSWPVMGKLCRLFIAFKNNEDILWMHFSWRSFASLLCVIGHDTNCLEMGWEMVLVCWWRDYLFIFYGLAHFSIVGEIYIQFRLKQLHHSIYKMEVKFCWFYSSAKITIQIF